jgi:lipopolysaccharide/colanic/teichoic acid biosynthesis glycosyltransferase
MERRRLQAFLALMLGDGAALMLGYTAAPYFISGTSYLRPMLVQAQIILPIYWSVAMVMQAYTAKAITRRHLAIGQALTSMMIAQAVVLLIDFSLHASSNLRQIPLREGLMLTMVNLALVRLALRPVIFRLCGGTAENLLIIEDGHHAPPLSMGYLINAAELDLRPDLDDPEMLHRIGLYLTNMDRVIVSCPRPRRRAWALVFKSANISGEIIDDEVSELGALGARCGETYGAMIVSRGPLGMHSRMLKRGFDVLISALAILALLPVLALVMALIRLEDGGPVLFIQKRTGRGNRFFQIYKFRSMRVELADAKGTRSASSDDERITRVGRLIRRTSLDELPQLFNVLRGDMSMVGPRPHAVGSLAGGRLFWEVDERYWLRHSLKPGLTGLAQVRGLRGATDTESDLARRLQADLEYLDEWTIWRDLAILLRTLRVVIHRKAF